MIYYLYSHIIDWPLLGLQYLQDLDQHMFQHFIPPLPKTMVTVQNLPCLPKFSFMVDSSLVFPNEHGCFKYEADHPHSGIGLGLYMYEASGPKCGLMSGAYSSLLFSRNCSPMCSSKGDRSYDA
jgi:hypothetical protein